MLRQSLAELTQDSDAVFVGTVRNLRGCWSDGQVSILTLVSIRPEKFLKGGANAKSLTLTVEGGRFGDYRLAVGTSPEFFPGERVIVFARRHPEDGLVVSHGFQGKFTIEGGRVEGPGLSEASFQDRVKQAVSGALPAALDPYSGPPTIIEGDEASHDHASLSYETLGVTFPTGQIPVSVFVNAVDGRPAQLTEHESRMAAVDAFHAWQNVPTSYIAFGPIQNTTRTSAAGDCDGFHDTTWGIAGAHSSSTLAVTRICYFGSTILDADVEVDNDHFGDLWRVDGSGNCDGRYDLQTVLLHEYGHMLGLGHPSNNGGCVSCPAMDASYGGIQRTPCVDDADGASALYPLGGGSPPSAPGGLSASSGTSITLSWSDVANELGFEIWRAALPCASAAAGDLRLHDTVKVNVLTYTDTDYGNRLPAATTFCYKVRSFNTNGESGFSATAEATTSGATPTPTASPTPTPSPTPTASPTPTPSPTPTESRTPTPSPSPTATTTPSPTATPTSLPTPTATPVATPTPAPTASSNPTPTPTPTPTASPTPTPALTASPTPTSEPTARPSPQGDVNCDGNIDTVDALIILRDVAGLTHGGQCLGSADVDCNGDIDSVDALIVLRFVAGLSRLSGACSA
jgi:hypothetical protein